MNTLIKQSLVFVGALLYGLTPALAAPDEADLFKQDIDLFLTDPSITPGKPNVLIIIDSAANYGQNLSGGVKRWQAYKSAITELFINSDEYDDIIRLGLMNWTFSSQKDGGKVISAIQDLNSSYRAGQLSTVMSNIGANADPWKGNNTKYALAFDEAYRYFEGKAVRSGTADGSGTYDPDALLDANTYKSPVANGCDKNFVILIAAGTPANNENSGNVPQNELASFGGSTSVLPMARTQYQSSWSDEWARFLKAEGITTFVIDAFDTTGNMSNNDLNARALLQSIGEHGGGGYKAVKDTAELKEALKVAVEKIQAVNSVFAATTLPISINVRGTNLNQVYMGVFRPDADKLPRWMGNLKLYQLAYNTNLKQIYLADSVGAPASDSVNGFIEDGAISFWTHDSTYWDYSPRGNPESASDSPDGKSVEKGGAGQRQRDEWPARTVYTCTGTCGAANTALTAFDTGNDDVTEGLLGAASSTERDELINWVRGQDVDLERTNGTTDGVRPSSHGDVLHSRPAVVNYNTTGDDNDVVVYYGANDGLFRAVKGGTADTDGTELWSLALPEFFPTFKRLRTNVEMNPATAATYKPYFVDGAIGVHTWDANQDGALNAADGDKVWLFLSMRRGGRFIYALDVSDRTSPKVLWKHTSAEADFSELGQTWSEPRLTYIPTAAGAPKPVVVFGAGYDANQDSLPRGASPSTDTMGRGIFVLDAETGAIIWSAGPAAPATKVVADMTYSIPSDVSVLTRQVAYTDAGVTRTYRVAYRFYVGDTGGNLWRVDTNDANASNWTVHKRASVGGDPAGDGMRKFFYAPDLVRDATSDAILMGSGNRERPFETSVTDRYYMFRDTAKATSIYAEGALPTITEANLYDATANLIQVGTQAQQEAAAASLAASNGWYISLGEGEKVVSGSITLGGTVFFGTNMPKAPTNECTNNLGEAKTYMMSYKDASATVDNDALSGLTTADRTNIIAGGGYPPTPVPAIVNIDGELRLAVIQGTEVYNAPGGNFIKRKRTFWFKETEN